MRAIKKGLNTALHLLGYTITKLQSSKSLASDINRLQKFAASSETLKLHFGCGPRILRGWINIDLSYAHYGEYLQYYKDTHYPEAIRGTRDDLFIVNVLNDGLPIADDSVDVIFHEDFFEHLTQKEQFVFLAETFRVLKPGGVHRVNTPNIVAAMRDNSQFSKGRKGVFTDEWDGWHHHNIISPEILQQMAQMVGYSAVTFNAKNQSVIKDQLPLEYRPNETDRVAPDSNVFADLIK